MKTGKTYTHQTMDIQTGETVTETVEVVNVATEQIFDAEITFADVRFENGAIGSIPDNHWDEYTEVK